MTLDTRIETKHRPMYGCHSYLDKYRHPRKIQHGICAYPTRKEEKACEGCQRMKDGDV